MALEGREKDPVAPDAPVFLQSHGDDFRAARPQPVHGTSDRIEILESPRAGANFRMRRWVPGPLDRDALGLTQDEGAMLSFVLRTRIVFGRVPCRLRDGFAIRHSQRTGSQVGAASEIGVDVTKILVHDGGGMMFQCGKQGLARLIEPALHRVEHGEVVVRLVHVGMVLEERPEDIDGVAHPSRARIENSVQQAPLWMTGVAFQEGAEMLTCFRMAFFRRKRQRALEVFLGHHHARGEQEGESGACEGAPLSATHSSRPLSVPPLRLRALYLVPLPRPRSP